MRSSTHRALMVLTVLAATAAPVYAFSCFVRVTSWGVDGKSPTGTITILSGNDSNKEGTFKTEAPYASHKGPIYGGPWTEETLTWYSVNFGPCDEMTESAAYNLTMWGDANFGGTNWQETEAPCGGGGGPA